MWKLGDKGSNLFSVLGLLYKFRRVADLYELEDLLYEVKNGDSELQCPFPYFVYSDSHQSKVPWGQRPHCFSFPYI